MAEKPETPSQGKPFEKEQAQLEGSEGGEKLAQQEAAEAAAPAPEATPSEPAEPQAEGTAAAETGVDKVAAEALSKGDASAKGAAQEASQGKGKKAKAKADDDTKAKDADKPKSKRGEKAATSAKPATKPSRRRRGARQPGEELIVVRAHAKYVRSSARKARLVCDQIRGKSVPEARALLAFSPRDVAEAWTKLLDSAVANAEHNHNLDGDDLKVLAVFADEGPTIKRFRPRAMGRATAIRKRTSHLTIQLTPKEL